MSMGVTEPKVLRIDRLSRCGHLSGQRLVLLCVAHPGDVRQSPVVEHEDVFRPAPKEVDHCFPSECQPASPNKGSGLAISGCS